MLKQPRGPGELWADWHTQSLGRVRIMLHKYEIERWNTQIPRGPAGHMARGDPIAAKMMQWRNLDMVDSGTVHSDNLGKPETLPAFQSAP